MHRSTRSQAWWPGPVETLRSPCGLFCLAVVAVTAVGLLLAAAGVASQDSGANIEQATVGVATATLIILAARALLARRQSSAATPARISLPSRRLATRDASAIPRKESGMHRSTRGQAWWPGPVETLRSRYGLFRLAVVAVTAVGLLLAAAGVASQDNGASVEQAAVGVATGTLVIFTIRVLLLRRESSTATRSLGGQPQVLVADATPEPNGRVPAHWLTGQRAPAVSATPRSNSSAPCAGVTGRHRHRVSRLWLWCHHVADRAPSLLLITQSRAVTVASRLRAPRRLRFDFSPSVVG